MSIIIGHTPQLLNGEESIIGDGDHTESEIDNCCIVIFCLDNGILSCIVFNFLCHDALYLGLFQL